jgi:hypothetical protein
MSIDAQHRFEMHLAGEIRDIAYETQPIILCDIDLPANILSSWNCLSAHC